MRSATKTAFHFLLCLLAAATVTSRNYGIVPKICVGTGCDYLGTQPGNAYLGDGSFVCTNNFQCNDCKLRSSSRYEYCDLRNINTCQITQSMYQCAGQCGDLTSCCYFYNHCRNP